MKAKLLVPNGNHFNADLWSENADSPIGRSNEGLEQQLARLTIEMRKKSDQLRAMTSKLAQVEQHERGRLAAILHDNLQQLLVGARLQISIVNPVNLPANERKALSQADKIIGQAIVDSRSLTTDLSPPILHGAGLGAALKWLAARMSELHGFTVNLSIDRRVEPQTESLRVLLFETVRELLFNSCKHSGGNTARVEITGEQGSWVQVVMEDAGKGFDPEAINADMTNGEKIGLFRIQQRLEAVGARMALTSEPGAGMRCEILAHIDHRERVGDCRPKGKICVDVERENETKFAVPILHGQKLSL